MLVKHMIIPFLVWLESYPGLLQKIILDETAFDLELGIKTDLHESSKPWGVVITNSLGIACKEENSPHNYASWIPGTVKKPKYQGIKKKDYICASQRKAGENVIFGMLSCELFFQRKINEEKF